MYSVSPEQVADIEKRFTYHRPGGDQPARYATLRGYARELAHTVCRMVPDGREKSLALTKLEEAIFWANAGIARNEQWAEPTPTEPLPEGVAPLSALAADYTQPPFITPPVARPFGGDVRGVATDGQSQIVQPIPGGTGAQQRFEQEHGMVASPKPPAQHVQVEPVDLAGDAGKNG